MVEVTLTQVEQLLAQLQQEAAQQAGRLAGLQRATSDERRSIAERAARAEAEIKARTDAWRAAELATLGRAHHERGRRASQQLAALAPRLAPGPLGLGWQAPEWPDPGLVMGHHVRLGTMQAGREVVPALLPLVGSRGWQVRSDDHTFAAIAHGLVVRALAAFGPALVRVTAFDPGLVSDLGLYAEVRQVDRASVPAPLTTSGAFEESLVGLAAHLGSVEDALASLGFRSVREEAAEAGRLVHPLHLLLVYGATGELSQQGAETLTQVLRTGGERGLFVLAHSDALRTMAPQAQHGLDKLLVRGGREAEHSALPGVRILLDAPPRRELILSVARAMLARPRQSTAPVLPLATLVDAIQDPWLDAGDQGIEVAYGRAGRADLVLRLRSQDPPMPNAIIGGAVGEGKSNLLLDLVYGLAARYSPFDLEMVLLDLKDGVEFGILAPDAEGRNWLPHVRVLQLDFDREFALAVLDWVTALVQQRGSAMRAVGASNIAEYRRTGATMPRLLVVVDEFQRLFEGNDDQVDEAARLLESLARTARSAGVHIVMASQTISGIRGLAAKSDAIFAQFHNRISLRNTAAESQAILSTHNTAAATLTHRGEVIANDGHGQDPAANVRGQSAYADKAYVRGLQSRLWVQGSTGVPPRIFRASSFATPVPTPRATGLTLFNVVPGAPVSVTEGSRVVALTRGPDQGVVLLGSERTLVVPTLVAALSSAVESRPDSDVVVLDGLGMPGFEHPVVAAVLRWLSEAGAATRHVPRVGLASAIAELTARVVSRPTLVVALGLDGVVELEQQDPDTYVAPTEALSALVRTGALNGTVVLGWWQSRARAEAQLGYGLAGVRAIGLCGLGLEDVQSIVGPGTKLPEGHPRILWFDRGGQRGCEVLVPFALPDPLKGALDG